MRLNKNERGNALIFVLIGVVLFAALAFTVARGFRSEGTSNLSRQKVSLIIADIASAGEQLEHAVSTIMTKGASESDVSFETENITANAKCTNDTCKVFNPNGGRSSWKTLPPDLTLQGNGVQRWQFSGTNEMPGVGDDGGTVATSDLIAFLNGVPADVCKQLNVRMTGSDSIPVLDNAIDTSTGEPFVGTYGTNVVTLTSGTAINGKSAYCVQNGSGGLYVFYYVLLPR